MANNNEPFSFGKPVMILAMIGVGFGGWYLYKTWPTSYEGPGWSIDFPPRWKITPAPDHRWIGEGPLGEKKPTGEFTQAKGMVSLTPHPTVSWPDMPLATLTSVAETHQDIEIDYKKSLLVTYTDGDYKYIGVVVDRVDVFVTYVIGCRKEEFDKHRPLLEKSIRSMKCSR